MAALAAQMPEITVQAGELAAWGRTWLGNRKSNGGPKPPNCFDKKQGMDFGLIFDRAFGAAIAQMLGNIPILAPQTGSLLPPNPDCVEEGKARLVVGICPQNYDAAYRPNAPRIGD